MSDQSFGDVHYDAPINHPFGFAIDELRQRVTDCYAFVRYQAVLVVQVDGCPYSGVAAITPHDRDWQYCCVKGEKSLFVGKDVLRQLAARVFEDIAEQEKDGNVTLEVRGVAGKVLKEHISEFLRESFEQHCLSDRYTLIYRDHFKK